MKEFIEKLIGRLEEEHERCINRYGVVGGNLPAMEVKQCMEIVNQLAEEYKGGWIPYATGCKMPNEASRVWLSFTTPVASFVKSAWYINGHFEWDNCRTVKETPTAWKPYDVPTPYQPKGE